MTDLEEIAGPFVLAISILRRRLRQLPVDDGVTLPEMTALVRLDRGGPQTGSALAKAEQISPQSMGATIATLEDKGLIERAPDPADGRRIVLSLTDAGSDVVRRKRAVRTKQLADVLATLDPADVELLRAATPAIERLAEAL